MRREELKELHYITLIDNVLSICKQGILSHNRARKTPHQSVAMPEIQERRRRVTVPGGRPLHDYVNLYFHARNPMMYRRRADHQTLCVLQVAIDVLDLPAVVITDRNASADYVRFDASPKGLSMVDRELTFAEIWTHSDVFEYWRRKSARCAEVLVPDRIDPRFILGAYISCSQSCSSLSAILTGAKIRLPLIINGHLFFQ